jgi:hypothetical protein
LVFHFTTTAGGDNRFFVPPIILLCMGIIYAILQYHSIFLTKIYTKYRLLCRLVILLIVLFPAISDSYNIKKEAIGYREIHSKIERETDCIPSKSTLFAFFGEKESYINYMRPDIKMEFAFESMDINIDELMSQNSPVYFYLSDNELDKIKECNNMKLYNFIINGTKINNHLVKSKIFIN